MKRFNRLVAMVLLVNFLSVFVGADFALAVTPVYPVQVDTHNQAVNLNQPGATPNNIGLTPKVQNAGTAVVDKTTGAVKAGVNGVKNVGTGIKNWWNNLGTQPGTVTTTTSNGTVISTPASGSDSTAATTTTASDSTAASTTTTTTGEKTSFWNKFRKSVGSGAHKLGEMIEPKASNTTTASDATATTTTTTTVSKDQAVNALVEDGAISVDKNGKAHYASGDKKGQFVSNDDLNSMVSEKTTQIQQTNNTTTTTTVSKDQAVNALVEDGAISVDKNGRAHYANGDKKGQFVSNDDLNSMVSEKTTALQQSNATASDATAKKPGIMDKVKDGVTKFKSDLGDGYQVGKTNAKAITKATLDFRHGAAWQNLAITGGVTIGANILSDVVNGRPVDIKGAVGSVFKREFAGGYVGGALGCAGGALAQGLLSAVPVVGPIIGAFMPALGGIVGGQLGSNLAGQTRNGKFSLKDALATIDPVTVTGQAIGSTIGAMLGSLIPIPVVGTMLGGMIGGWLGGKAANFVKGLFGGKTGNKANTDGVTGNSGSTTGSSSGTVDPGSFSAREAQKAYQDYIASYNRLTDLMTAGKGDTAEAQEAYAAYKAAKEKYESLTNAMK